MSALTMSRSKSRQYDEQQWSSMRPIIHELYINQGLLLEDVLEELRSKYDMHPTKSMCKWRLSIWGMKKNVKSAQKEEALGKLPDQGLAVHHGIRPDKLVRYQKESRRRARLVALRGPANSHNQLVSDAGDEKRVLGSRQRSSSIEPWHYGQAQEPGITLDLPEEYASVDTSLRAAMAMMSLQKATCRKRSSSVYIQMGNLIQSGMSLWDVNASAEGRSMFSNAAITIDLQLQRGVALDIRFVYYLCPEVWSAACNSHFEGFRIFLGRVVEQNLGTSHPISIIVRSFQGIKGGQARLRVWDCLLDHFVKPDQHKTIWWDLAKARWFYCRRIGLYEQAAESCQRALSVMKQLGVSTSRMEADVLLELSRLAFKTASYDIARDILSRLVRLASREGSACWRVMPLALLYLAHIHEISSSLDEACECLKQRLDIAFQNDGVCGAQTLRCCRDLLRFQRRNPGSETRRLSHDRYSQVCYQLEAITQGDWKLLDDDCIASMSRAEKESLAVQRAEREVFEVETCADSE